jgi:hypothetical protein
MFFARVEAVQSFAERLGLFSTLARNNDLIPAGLVNFLENPFVSRVSLRMCILIVRLLRPMWLVQMRSGSGLP